MWTDKKCYAFVISLTSQHCEPHFAAALSANLLGFFSTSFVHPEMSFLLIVSQKSSSLVTLDEFFLFSTDSELNLGLYFDWAIHHLNMLWSKLLYFSFFFTSSLSSHCSLPYSYYLFRLFFNHTWGWSLRPNSSSLVSTTFSAWCPVEKSFLWLFF